jgi:hypothetical protein
MLASSGETKRVCDDCVLDTSPHLKGHVGQQRVGIVQGVSWLEFERNLMKGICEILGIVVCS